jgi:hypothetical protein
VLLLDSQHGGRVRGRNRDFLRDILLGRTSNFINADYLS